MIQYFMKKYGYILFLAIAFIFLYVSQITYGERSLNKSIQACVIAQMKLNNKLEFETAKDYCIEEIKKNK